MWHGDSCVRVARTTKEAQMLVGGRGIKQGKMRTRSLNRRCEKTVLQVCSCVKSFWPITPGEENLNQQSVDGIVNRTNNTFSFTILWRHVRTRHPELCAVRQKEDPGGRVVKLTLIVTLDSFDSRTKLSRHIGKEIGQSSEGVRFKIQEKSP
jgi:hypothetical protein